MTLIPILAGLCPTCGAELAEFVVDQPALFVHGGHGATERSRVQFCACGWQVRCEVSEVRPT